jgi:RIO kinase 1
MVRLWAEKEMRNLKRLLVAGIPCPEPLEVKENILVMSFLGSPDGWWVLARFWTKVECDIIGTPRASPRLKDAEIPSLACAPLYSELVLTVRKLFHACKLVHADLSEYNILYHNSHLYVIDVSQSVEQDHPNAFDFLRSDIKNVEEFWGRMGVSGLGVRREEDNGAANAHEDSVFLQSYIPRSLNEVYDPERDVAALNRGEGKGLIYADTIGLVEPSSKNGTTNAEVHFEDEEEASTDSDEGEEYNEGDETNRCQEEYGKQKPRGHRHEDRDAKKVLSPCTSHPSHSR